MQLVCCADWYSQIHHGVERLLIVLGQERKALVVLLLGQMVVEHYAWQQGLRDINLKQMD